MDDFGDKIKSLLSDPEGMNKVMQVAKALGEGNKLPIPEKGNFEESSESRGTDSGNKNDIFSFLNMPELKKLIGEGNKERIALLTAIRPFVKDDKREKLDGIIKTMKTLEIFGSAQSLFNI